MRKESHIELMVEVAVACAKDVGKLPRLRCGEDHVLIEMAQVRDTGVPSAQQTQGVAPFVERGRSEVAQRVELSGRVQSE